MILIPMISILKFMIPHTVHITVFTKLLTLRMVQIAPSKEPSALEPGCAVRAEPARETLMRKLTKRGAMSADVHGGIEEIEMLVRSENERERWERGEIVHCIG